jgi:hypothetical protein
MAVAGKATAVAKNTEKSALDIFFIIVSFESGGVVDTCLLGSDYTCSLLPLPFRNITNWQGSSRAAFRAFARSVKVSPAILSRLKVDKNGQIDLRCLSRF